MKIKNVHKEIPYWDEGQSPNKLYRWYKKGKWKRWLRKKWIKAQLKEENFE